MKLNISNGLQIPWYRTRIFWGVIFSILVAWSFFFYFFTFYRPGYSLDRLFIDFSFAFGSSFFTFFGLKIFGQVGSFIFTFLYYFIILFLGYKTFIKPQVELYYPIILVFLFIVGIVTIGRFLSGL